MKVSLVTLFLVLATSGCVESWAEQTLTTKRQSFAAGNLTNARLETGAGGLTITGRRGISAIEVVADYKGRPSSSESAQRIIDRLRLTMEVRGNTFYLKTDNENNWRSDSQGWIDLSVTLPAGLALDIVDGSGSIAVSGMDSNVTVEDGSGEVEIDTIRGSLKVRDGSGSIRIRDIEQNVDIRDGSGSIDISRVGNDVTISDGSGSVDVVDVAGRLEVTEGGSGSINHRGVRGEVRVPEKRKHRRN